MHRRRHCRTINILHSTVLDRIEILDLHASGRLFLVLKNVHPSGNKTVCRDIIEVG